MLNCYFPRTRRFAASTAILRTLLFCRALMATLRAVLLLISLIAMAFFTACVSFGFFVMRLLSARPVYLGVVPAAEASPEKPAEEGQEQGCDGDDDSGHAGAREVGGR